MRVVRESGDGRTIEMYACGRVVRYQNIADSKAWSPKWLYINESGPPSPDGSQLAD